MLGMDKPKSLAAPRFDGNPPKIAIIAAHYYADIGEALVAQAKDKLKEIFSESDCFDVPGILELAPALRIAVNSGRYDGFVVLGAICDGENGEEVIFKEALRAVGEIAASGAAVGQAIIWAENKKKLAKATAKRGDLGGAAAMAALHLVDATRRTQAVIRPGTSFRPEAEHIIMAGEPDIDQA